MTRPVVTVDLAVRWGQPCIRTTRVLDLAGTHWAGDDACDEYDITRPELLTACWHMAIYGVAPEPPWRRWKAWADGHFEALARGEYERVPDPPTKETYRG